MLHFELRKNPKSYLVIGFIGLLIIPLALLLGAGLTSALLSGLLTTLTLSVKVRLEEKLPFTFGVPLLVMSSLAIFLYMQFIISAGVSWMRVGMFALNLAFFFGVQSAIFAISGNIKIAVLSVTGVSAVVGIIDHLVVQTRAREICFSDIWSISTGLSVASGYSYTFARATVNALFLLIPFVIFFVRTEFWFPFRRLFRLPIGVIGMAAAVGIGVLVSTASGASAVGFREQYWRYHASAYNGFYLNFIHTFSATRVRIPNGYSQNGLDTLLKEYQSSKRPSDQPDSPVTDPESNPGATVPPTSTPITTVPPPPTTAPDAPGSTVEDSGKPNLIVIMDETFSDLQAISQWMAQNGYDNELLETNIEVLPFWNSLSSSMPNVERGWAISSVYGGNTANSEFEFLTGHTMAFLPTNTVAYNLYLNSTNAFSIVDLLNGEGYYTVGMHPEDATNWNRDKLYSAYGFQKTLFIDDFESLTEADYYREHVSDRAVFSEIIRQYEQKEEGTPLFTFAVTMMNHGGYATPDFKSPIEITNHKNYSSLSEYLASVHESDKAIEELIAYFSEADEDTVIVIFGDHQPNMPEYIYPMFFGIDNNTASEDWQSRYAIPYMIWANYDFESDDADFTSINYLSGKMLEVAGVEKTPYLDFVAELRDNYPAISAAGYWDSEGEYHPFLSQHAPDEETMLRLYEYLEYNALFDKPENKLYSWFRKDDPTPLGTREPSQTE